MKLEQAARQSFETWWESEGQEFLYALNTTTDDDIKLVAEVAWKNGAYCAEQAEQKPIGYVIEDNDYEGSKIRAEPINGCCLPVYLAPVRTKDLTDDEIVSLAKQINGIYYDCDCVFARAVIAADREKNK